MNRTRRCQDSSVNTDANAASPSVCDLAGLDPSSAAPANVSVTHLGRSTSGGGWEVPRSIPAFVVHHLFSPAECTAVIAATPGAGPGFMDERGVAARYRGRTCTRLASHDPSMAQLVERRLRALSLLPTELDGGRLLGVSPRWRHVHYKGAQRGHQEYHIDGQWHALIGCYGLHHRPAARSN